MAEDRPQFVKPGGGAPGAGVRFVRPQASSRPGREPGDAVWPGWLGPVAVVVGYAVVFVAAAVLLVLASPSDVSEFTDANTHWFALIQDVLWVGVALLLPYMVVRHLRATQLGLNGAPFGRSLGIGVASVIAFYALSAAYTQGLGISSDDNQLLKELGFGEDVGTDIAYALVYTVGAPVAEELLFRGVLFGALRGAFRARFGARGGVALAVVISGVIFGGVHAGGGQDAFLPMLMALGMLLALAYHWSGTLYVPIVMHAWNNAIATGIQSSADGKSAILNPDVTEPWIAYLVLSGPVLALVTAILLARFVRTVFPSDPPSPARERPADV